MLLFYCVTPTIQTLFHYLVHGKNIIPTGFRKIFVISTSTAVVLIDCCWFSSSPQIASVHEIQFFNIITFEIRFPLYLGH